MFIVFDAGNLIFMVDDMKLIIKEKTYEFKLSKAIFILIWIYLFSLTCPYWIDKVEVLIANEKKKSTGYPKK